MYSQGGYFGPRICEDSPHLESSVSRSHHVQNETLALLAPRFRKSLEVDPPNLRHAGIWVQILCWAATNGEKRGVWDQLAAHNLHPYMRSGEQWRSTVLALNLQFHSFRGACRTSAPHLYCQILPFALRRRMVDLKNRPAQPSNTQCVSYSFLC